jgi:hypothetical protein
MGKLKSFVRLDFLTVKPYFTIKNMLIYAVVAIFFTLATRDITPCLFVGFILSTMFIGYPFAVGEKSNMDALYTTLSICKSTVVLGRYVFTLALNLYVILISFVLAVVVLLAAQLVDFYTGTVALSVFVFSGAEEKLWMTALLAAAFITIQAIQLPIYFRHGYTKAKFFSLIPFVAIMAGYIVYIFVNSISGIYGASAYAINSGTALIAIVANLLLIVYVSYRLSLSFYKKREF